MNRIYYIGDSTVQENKFDTYPQTGMAQTLGLYLNPDIRVEPRGKNGRSTKSFLDEGLFAPVERNMGPGDYLLIQFGHNDEKEDPLRHTDSFGSFQENLLYFIRQARRAGAMPMLITPIARRRFDDAGNFLTGSHGAYPEAIRRLGAREGVPVADLTAATEALLESMGEEGSRELFLWPKDNTHLTYAGAVKMAGLLRDAMASFGPPWKTLLYVP